MTREGPRRRLIGLAFAAKRSLLVGPKRRLNMRDLEAKAASDVAPSGVGRCPERQEARKDGDRPTTVGLEPLSTRTTAQIGRCGELLVQFRLLTYGIETSPMTTDRGIDLVAFAASSHRALTIQVKTNLRPKPGGGRGALALDWWISEASPADLVALVDLATESAWLFSHAELDAFAQQRSSGRLHFYFYLDAQVRARRANCHALDFERYRLEHRVAEFFDVPNNAAGNC